MNNQTQIYDLTIIDDTPIYKNKKQYLLCKCVCGTIKEIRKDCLFDKRESKRIKSCGCGKNLNRYIKPKNKESMYNLLYRDCKYSSRYRNLECSLSLKEHTGLVKQNCYYCGSSPTINQRVGKNKKLVGEPIPYNGIDRINSNIGYTLENCVPCCPMCNKMKMDLSTDKFIEKLLEIFNTHNLGNV